MHNKILLIILLGCLVGCGSNVAYNIKQTNELALRNVKQLSVEYQPNNEFINVDTVLDPQDALNTSQGLTSASNQPPPPGASSGEAAAGQLIATLILAANSQNTANNKAQAKIAHLTSDVSDKQLKEIINAALERTFAHLKTIPVIANGGSQVSDAKLLVKPEILFSNNLNRVKIKADISIVSSMYSKPVYVNSFEYWSTVVLPQGDEETREAYWAQNNGENIARELKAGASSICEMLDLDLAAVLNRNVAVTPTVKTIHYEEAGSTSFMRGEVLSANDDRFIAKDLRGNLKSIGGKLN